MINFGSKGENSIFLINNNIFFSLLCFQGREWAQNVESRNRLLLGIRSGMVSKRDQIKKKKKKEKEIGIGG